jgi:hypothetical protein
VKADDPTVIADPTWDNPQDNWNLGIPFSTRWLASQELPLIDNWENDYPLMRNGVPPDAVHTFPDRP